METCFVMQPFDGGRFDKRFEDVFAPAIRGAGLEPYRVDRDPGSVIPVDDIGRGIQAAAVCLAEITEDNPNVWYELGAAVAYAKPICLVCSKERKGKFPFDVAHRTIIHYDHSSKSDFEELERRITERLLMLKSDAARVRAIANIERVEGDYGLRNHELAALTMIAGASDEDGLSVFFYRQGMEAAGYNEVARAVAAEGLRRRGYIKTLRLQDERGEDYTAHRVEKAGMDWLLENQDRMELRLLDPQSMASGRGSDIPF